MQADDEALLDIREENTSLKRHNEQLRQRIKELVAQVARTETSAKRAILSSHPSAKRGFAQQLLNLEWEVERLTAAKSRAERQAVESQRALADLQGTCERQKQRLSTVLSDQRRLVVQLGEAQQRAGLKGAGLRPSLKTQKGRGSVDEGASSSRGGHAGIQLLTLSIGYSAGQVDIFLPLVAANLVLLTDEELLVEGLKAQVRVLQQQLLTPGQDAGKLRQLQADLESACQERDHQRVQAIHMSEAVRDLQVRYRPCMATSSSCVHFADLIWG